MTDVRDIEIMRTEIESIPDVLAGQMRDLDGPATDLVARAGLAGTESGSLRLVMTGCGDSYFSGIAARQVFSHFAGVDAIPIEALEFARYDVDRPMPDGVRRVLVAVSYSGEVGRTIEAVMAARERGWHTIALTGRSDGRLAGAVDDVLVMDVPTLGTSPGTSTYASMVIALCLMAAAIAEAHGRPDARQDLISALRAVPGLAERTTTMAREPAEQLVELWRDATVPVFLGAGPSLATAHFGAAKIYETVQRPAIAEHLEEWAHMQYFASDRSKPTVIVAPSGRSHSRATELLSEMRYIETPGVLVTDDDTDVGPGILRVPIAAGAPEPLTPLLSCLPLAYAVAVLGSRLGKRSYGFRSEEHEREHYDTIHRVGPVEPS